MEVSNTKESPAILDPRHWSVFYLLSAFSTLIISLTVAVQPLFLDEVLGISFEEAGTINSNIIVVAQMISLAVIVIYFGQKTIYAKRIPLILLCFLMAAVGTLLIPMCKQIEVMIGLESLIFFYMMRVLISVSTETVQLQISTLGGDVAAQMKSSTLLTNMVLMMVIGGTVVTAIFMQIPQSMNHIEAFMLIPFFIALVGVYLVKQYLPRQLPPLNLNKHTFERVWELVTNDPRMQLCFAAAFYIRADMIVISLFLSLWCISLADVVGVTRDFAAARAGLLLGVMGLTILFSMPLWKLFMAHQSRIGAIGVSLSISGFGFLFLGVVSNPFDGIAFVPMILIGIGQAGCLVAPKDVAAELAPKELLGSVQGMFQLISGVGVIMLVQSGGYYFDAVDPGSPFILMGSGHLFVMVFAQWLILSGMDENINHQIKKKRKGDLKPLIFMMALLPLIWLVGRVLISGYVPGTSLGQMPVGFINRYLGDWAFNFLIISLGLRPFYEVTGIRKLAKYSRMIGLYAFFYAVLHALTYVWLEWVFDWSKIIDDIINERSFIVLGSASLIMLTMLAVTSNTAAMIKMGGQNWKKLHRCVYVINVLIALHFILAATHENGEPYVYGAIVLSLLGYRFNQYYKERYKNNKINNGRAKATT